MKESEDEKIWISIYLYDSDANFIITNIIDPFIKKYNIKKYFFIRYVDELGPHVRFRINVLSKENTIIKEKLEKYIKDSIINTYKFEEYVPEIDRYGGTVAIKIAEDFFCFTSELAVKMVGENSPWTITKAQSLILQLYFLFFKTIEVNKNSINWMFNVIENNHWNKITENLLGEENKTIVFKEAFNKNRGKIILLKNSVYSQIEDKSNDIFNDFIEKTNEIETNLDALIDDNLIDFGDNFINNFNEEKKSFIKVRLYISYLHMINNRFGLANYDEAYIFYILKEVFENEVQQIIQ